MSEKLKLINLKFRLSYPVHRHFFFIQIEKMKSFLYKISLLFFLIVLLSSCKDTYSEKERFYLSNGWSYSEYGEPHEFHPLADKDLPQLVKLLPDASGYIFIKKSFNIPQHFRHKEIYLFLGRVKIAAKVYLNGHLLGQAGFFPPHEFTEGEKSSYFKIPKEYINFSDKNTIMICVWCNEYGTIQDMPFISASDDVIHKAEFENLVNSKIYMIFSVVLLIVFLIYFFLFLLRRSEIENLSFSQMCFSTALYLVTFYIGEYSIIYKHIYSFLLFEQIFNGTAPIITSYFVINFTRDFLKHRERTFSRIGRFILTLIALALPFCTSDLSTSRLLLRYGFLIMVVQFIYPTVLLIKALQKKESQAIKFILCFVPIYLVLIYESFTRLVLKQPTNTLILSISWLCVIFLFLGLLIVNFVQLAGKVEYMNKHLENLVVERTQALENERNRAVKEIDLAGFVQKNFYNVDTSEIKNWEIKFAFKAMSGVSGDLYILFMSENHLNGVGIFDISGHGIASGLVTMLVKNIIEQEFKKGMKHPLHEVMAKINERIILEKGSIENYLTGLIIRFSENYCELVNAGHPKALLYSAKNKILGPIEQDGVNQFGAIGIPDFPISFESLKFKIHKGDEIVLYTDGITECTNAKKEYFGSERIMSVFKENVDKPLENQVNAMTDTLFKFSGTEKLNDDITYLILKKL